MFVMVTEIVLHQIIVFVIQDLFMKIVNIQFVLILYQMKQMYVQEKVFVHHQIIVLV
jgi:hypothetical protein